MSCTDVAPLRSATRLNPTVSLRVYKQAVSKFGVLLKCSTLAKHKRNIRLTLEHSNVKLKRSILVWYCRIGVASCMAFRGRFTVI